MNLSLPRFVGVSDTVASYDFILFRMIEHNTAGDELTHLPLCFRCLPTTCSTQLKAIRDREKERLKKAAGGGEGGATRERGAREAAAAGAGGVER